MFADIDPPKIKFPSGLIQPEGSYRFGLDALLLASYANILAKEYLNDISLLDLGCGCGAACFGFALQNPEAICAGYDREKELIEAARKNSELLKLTGRCFFDLIDLNDLNPKNLKTEFNIILTNPPWRIPGKGKISPSKLRARALWQEPETFCSFAGAATFLLKHNGLFLCMLPPEAKKEFCLHLENMTLIKELAIYSFENAPINRLILVFQKNEAVFQDFENYQSETLILHCKNPDVNSLQNSLRKNLWTPGALAFCPWLL